MWAAREDRARDMKVTFYCGPSLEPWSPRSAETGIGGSQEAVIEMAAQLLRLGHEIAVYNDCGEMEGDHRGVRYYDYRRFPDSRPSDILVVWRWPSLLGALPGWARPGQTCLWLHDHVPAATLAAAAPLCRKIIVMSRYHRGCYPQVGEERFYYSRNGITPEHFLQPVARDPWKVVYGSEYHRGLWPLLRAWGRVQAEAPRARLTVFYGWQTSRRYAFLRAKGWRQSLRNNPATFLVFQALTEHRLRRCRAQHLGRIGHAAVAREFLSAGVWAYPAWSPETSCITAMKAQAGGALPVVIPSGALGETVQFGYKSSRSANDHPGNRERRHIYEEWTEALIDWLRHPDKQVAVRGEMMAASLQSFAWQGVAEEWAREFTQWMGPGHSAR